MQPRGAQDLAPTRTYKAPITLRVGSPGAYVSPINHHREAPQNGQEDTGPLGVGRHGPSLGVEVNKPTNMKMGTKNQKQAKTHMGWTSKNANNLYSGKAALCLLS